MCFHNSLELHVNYLKRILLKVHVKEEVVSCIIKINILGVVAAPEEHRVRKLQTGVQDGLGRGNF